MILKKIIKLVGCVLVLALLVFMLFIALNAWAIYRFSKVDETRKADVAIILGAALNAHSEPSPVFRERINHGVSLYKRKIVKKLIISGGYGRGSKISDAAVGKHYAVSQGVKAEDIFVEEFSRTTRANLLNSRILMRKQRLNTALLVSDPLHMKRVSYLAKSVDLEAYSSPTQTTKYRGREAKLNFLLREVFIYTHDKLEDFWRSFNWGGAAGW